HGWKSTPGGVKPTYLARHGHDVLNPALPDDDFDQAIRVAQSEFDRSQPDAVVGTSRGGAVAMNLQTGSKPSVVIWPAWKRWGSARTVKPNTLVLHSEADEVIPIEDSRELLRNSSLPATSLIVTGTDHRLADPASLEALHRACEHFQSRANP